jgi:hypothetical protein
VLMTFSVIIHSLKISDVEMTFSAIFHLPEGSPPNSAQPQLAWARGPPCHRLFPAKYAKVYLRRQWKAKVHQDSLKRVMLPLRGPCGLRPASPTDSAAVCEILALLDYFSRYHQIWLRKEDEEKTSFITPFDTYCYLRMSEGVKNASPMFCRMTKVILKDQMQRNVFAYVDDIMVASKRKPTQIQDLAETFANMRRMQLKLKPEKCVFGV